MADDLLGEGSARGQGRITFAAGRHLFKRGNGRNLTLAREDAEVAIARPDHDDALPIPTVHRDTFVAGRLADLLLD